MELRTSPSPSNDLEGKGTHITFYFMSLKLHRHAFVYVYNLQHHSKKYAWKRCKTINWKARKNFQKNHQLFVEVKGQNFLYV